MAAAAAADSVKRIKAEVTCSICRELLRDPVTTACGHSFCERCITRLCQGREDAACPQCRQGLRKRDFRLNRELKNIVDLLKSQTTGKPAGWNMCERHQEPMKLYCKQDKSPICLVCMQSEAHQGHRVVPKEEAVKEYKEKITEQLESIESSCGKLDQFVSEVWKHLSENEQDEEHHKLARVSEKLTTVLKKRTGTPGKSFAAIVYKMLGSSSESDSSESDDSEETERQGHSGREPGREPAAEKQETTGGLVGKETPTCKNELSQGSLDTVIHKIRGTRGDAEPKVDAQQTENRSEDPGSQMEPEQSLSRSELPAREVSKETERQGHSVEVTLDPATAHPLLVLSEDRKSARRGDTKQDLPDNPERFDTCISVLGSEGFTSGRRYWEVEVGPREGWAIGVARDSVQRKGGIQLKPHMGIWALIPSEKSQVPRKVGVYLDYEGGEMRFYNAETMALISSHTATFTGRLVPFFSLWAVGSRISLSPSQR